jgi:hypothetical protein
VNGTELVLTWPGSYLGWYAQSNAVAVASTSFWYDIPGSELWTNLSVRMDLALGQVFYRLRRP